MILLALGANLPSRYGSPDDTLHKAVEVMQARGLHVAARSSVWLTAPVPASDQPLYHNAVVAVETPLQPLALLALLHGIEDEMGRERTEKNAPRVIDLDLVAYHDAVIAQDDVYIPHPRAHERGFVLKPLAEICPEWVHPVMQVGVSDLLARLPEAVDILLTDQEAV